jgi:hypothetical protein
MRFISKVKNAAHQNSSFFILIGSVCLLYVLLSYTLPALDTPQYQAVTQNILVPICVGGAIFGYSIAGVVGYMSSGKESGYVVIGFIMWLLLTGVSSYVFISSSDGFRQATTKEERAADRQEIISGSERWLSSLVDFHATTEGSYAGLCEALPNIAPQINMRNSFQKDLWRTMKCESTEEAYALSFGDTLTDWRWCMDSAGFAGEGRVNQDAIHCAQ